MVDVAAEMRTVEAEVGGRMGAAISGAKTEAPRLRGAGGALKSGLRGIAAKVADLGIVTLVIGGIVIAAACATPFATWSAYHSGRAIQAERDRAADAEAVAKTATHDKVVVEKASAKLAKTDEADRAEIRRLHGIADRLSRRPAAKPLCPTTVYEVLHASGYTPVPGHQ